MEALITGTAETRYTRHPEPGMSTHELLAEAVAGVLADAGLSAGEVDGLAVSSFSLGPDHAIDLAWRLGLSLSWIMQDTNGGASAVNMLGHACRAVQSGDARAVVLVAGDAQDPGAIAERQATFNRATAEHLAPLHYGGPNSLFAMLTQRQMEAHDVEAADYGCVAISGRAWAAGNPGAVYRAPLTLEEYLRAPLVADPLRRYDCVPGVAGADALLVAAPDLARTAARPGVSIRALRASFNHDQQDGDGLQTGLATIASQLWDAAAAAPGDVDVACIYDDYPAMVLAQLADLGFAPDGDLRRLARVTIGQRRLAVNTSGGMLSAGQAGAAGGMHGLVEAVRQLRGEAGARQVPGARLALATGYGMILYRYGAAATAVVLEATSVP
jgi:acetyl-CoA acetyltransferase